MVDARFATLATGTYSSAPAEVLPTVKFREALRRFGIITPCAPAASAVLITAPRLCVSSTPSQIIINGFSFFSAALFKISSTVEYSCAAAERATPWCTPPPHIKSSFFESTSLMTAPFSRAIEINLLTAGFCSPRWTNRRSISRPDLIASNTAFLPIIKSFWSFLASSIKILSGKRQ